MKPIKERTTVAFLMVLSVLLVMTVLPISDREVLGSEEAGLGFSLGGVLLRWNLISSGLVAAEDESVSVPLEESLDSLEDALTSTGFSEELVDRVKPLRAKLEAAKAKSLWSIQLGYWSFSQEEPSIVLNGARRESVNEEARFQSYRYLDFPEEDGHAVVDLTEKPLPDTMKRFTFSLWINPDGQSTGNLVEGDNWRLVLRDGDLALELPGGSVSGVDITSDYWSNVAIVTDGDSTELYRNGLSAGKTDLPEPMEISTELELGKGFVGKLDELRLKPESVKPEEIYFDRPLDYLLGFPVISQASKKFQAEESWRFYAGLLVSSLTVKEDSGVAAVKAKDLENVSRFLLGGQEDLPDPPDSLPESVQGDMEELRKLGEQEELSERDREAVKKILNSLVSYLDPRGV
ncbi:LamG domain-containing protein [Candidatus Bipolaricaulota bacterium]|nr:LamG domain-containing protein [Candidatus Bipolaricaulota bacterium]